MALPDPSRLLKRLALLLVDADGRRAEACRASLLQAGMTVRVASAVPELMRVLAVAKPDIVLLHLDLPEVSGAALIPWLAQHPGCGIICLMDGNDADRLVLSIELGADDCVAADLPARELLARIRAVHRRLHPPAAAAASPVQLDRQRQSASVDGGPGVALTSAEFVTLDLLIEAGGATVSRERICGAALNRRLGAEDRSVDQLVLGLRRKLGERSGGRLISSVRGSGYALRGNAPPPAPPAPPLDRAGRRLPSRRAPEPAPIGPGPDGLRLVQGGSRL